MVVIGGSTSVFAQDPPPVDIFVTETVGVSDDSGASGPAAVDATEAVSVNDVVSVVGPAIIAISESIVVSDSGGPLNAAPIVDAGLAQTIDEGSTATLGASVIVLDPELTTATIDWGDGSLIDQVIPSSDGAISAIHLYADDGVYNVLVTVDGLFGDQGTDTTQISVLNLPPVIAPAGPFTADLADPIGAIIAPEVFDPGDDPLTFDWDLDGDGQFGDSSNQAAIIDSQNVGVYVVSLQVEDDQGASATESFEVSVIDTRSGDVPPAGDPQIGDESAPVRIVFRTSNDSAGRSFRVGDRILLDARVVPIADRPSVVIDHVEFTMNGLPLPSEAQVVQTTTDRTRLILPREVTTEGAVLEFVATAFDNNNDPVADATLTVNIISGLLVQIRQETAVATQDRRIRYSVRVEGTSAWPLTYNWSADTQLIVPTGLQSPVLVIDPISGTPYPETIEISLTVEDQQGAQGIAKHITTVQPTDPSLPTSEHDELPSEGKVQGRSIIGRLVQLTSSSIVVRAKVGNDFTDVRVHIDPAATEMNAEIGAEAFATGSKVVVIADRDVLSGDAIAQKIRAIPSESTRKHDRVLVSKPDDGNSVVLTSADGSDDKTTIADNDGRFRPGDLLIAISRKNKTGNSGRGPSVLVNADAISDRLKEYAQKKFEDGDADASGLIDRLERLRRDREQQRIDEAKRHADESVKRAAILAEEKAKRRAEKEAADPIRAIRTQAVVASENEVVECASRLVGRPIRGESDLTDAERRRVVAECAVNDNDERRIPDGDRSSPPAEPPAAVLECITRVLGSVPTQGLTKQDQARVKAACVSDDDEDDDDSASGAGDRRSDSAKEARKRAFCQANPSDSHCTSDGRPVESDDSSAKSGDLTEAEKVAFCRANPTNPRCTGATGSAGANTGDRDEAAKIAFCAANPTDPRCVRDTGDDDKTETDPGVDGKDESDGDQTDGKSDAIPTAVPTTTK